MEFASSSRDIMRSEAANLLDQRGQSPLNYAVQRGHNSAINWLCGQGAIVDDRSVFTAAVEGHVSCLKSLLHRGGNPNARAYNLLTDECEDETALWDTCGQGLEDVVQVLLDAGADPDELSPPTPDLIEIWEYPTPAFVAACFGGSRHIVETLFLQTKDLHLYLDYCLDAAILRGHEAVIRFLLPKLSPVDQKSEREERFLSMAMCLNLSSSIVELLLDSFGSSADLVVHLGKDGPPLSIIEVPYYYENRETVQMLLMRGATPPNRMLLTATKRNDAILLEKFLQRDVDMTMSLHTAAKYGSLQAAKLLIAKGVAIDGTDGQSKTPLIIAAESGFAEMVKLLLENGASTEARDDRGNNARISAGAKGHAHAVRALDEFALKMKN